MWMLSLLDQHPTLDGIPSGNQYIQPEAPGDGPAPNSGDGIPSGNQYIQPEAPGDGPAPNSGDGIPDGSGF